MVQRYLYWSLYVFTDSDAGRSFDRSLSSNGASEPINPKTSVRKLRRHQTSLNFTNIQLFCQNYQCCWVIKKNWASGRYLLKIVVEVRWAYATWRCAHWTHDLWPQSVSMAIVLFHCSLEQFRQCKMAAPDVSALRCMTVRLTTKMNFPSMLVKWSTLLVKKKMSGG